MLHKRLIIDGQEFPLAAAQSGHGAPCDTTPGCVGVTYMDEDTGEMYKCISCVDNCTQWKPMAGGTELEERVETLEEQLADLLYTAISITSFGHNAGTQEMGATVTALTLSWKTNKTPTALTLDGEAIDVNLTSKALSGLSITKDSGKSWTLKATDERDAVATKSTSISFLNGVYYGAASNPAAINSAFVLGLTKTLTSTRARTITVDAGAGEHIWYCLPTRLGKCTFTVGGFEGGFDLVDTISFTNSSGFTENYYIYRSSQTDLGSTKVVVS